MKFTVYSKEGCSFCKKAEQMLDIAKVDYVVYKLDDHFTKEGFISEFGNSSFPRITVDGKLIGGCLDTFRFLEERNLV